MRCALLGPTPGSLPSSSMRSWTAPSYTRRDYDLGTTVSSGAAPGCRGRRSGADEPVVAGLVEGRGHLVVGEIALGDHRDDRGTAVDHLDLGVEHAVEGLELVADRLGAVPAGEARGREPPCRRHACSSQMPTAAPVDPGGSSL